MATRRLHLFPCCVLLAIFGGCTHPPRTTTSTDIGPSYVAPPQSGPATIDGISYEYVATSARQAAILAGFAKLKVGQSREEVRQALGAPDKAQIAQGKLYNSPRCWVYMYKIKMRTSGPNTKDICVEVSFDSDGKLNWAMPENIAGLNEARSPGDR